jgi:hypothetical protein
MLGNFLNSYTNGSFSRRIQLYESVLPVLLFEWFALETFANLIQNI